MSIIGIIGWVLVGAVLSGFLIAFWEEIKVWLNNSVANFVEKHLGYGARKRMHRAIVTIDKVINKIRNTSVIYTKRNDLDEYYDKTTVVSETEVNNIDKDILEKIKEDGNIIQEFEYKQTL